MAGEPASDELESRASRLFPSLYDLGTVGPVSFEHIAQARRIRRIRSQYWSESHLLERRLRQRYQADSHDRIKAEYWCDKAYAGCALTESGRILSVLNTFVPDLLDMDVSIKQLARDAAHVFSGDNRDQRDEIAETLYSAMGRVMASADVCDSQPSPEQQGLALTAARTEWAAASARAMALIQRQARFEYAVGALVGAVTACALSCVIGVLASRWPEAIIVPTLLAATLAGSLGALISVLQRLSHQDLVLDYTASRRQKILLGAARPFIGAVFAAFVQFALIGGLLTVQGSVTASQMTPATFAFFSVAGFASGFSERFATGILERAGAGIAATHEQSGPPSGGMGGSTEAKVPPPSVPAPAPAPNPPDPSAQASSSTTNPEGAAPPAG